MAASDNGSGNQKVYTAHEKQAAFHHYVRQYTDVLFNGGRGSGKTTAGAIQAVLESTHYQKGERGIIVAPTYPMLEDATMYEFFEWLPRQFISEFQKQRRVLTLTTGSEIAFRSADNPDSLRGPNRAWGWIDEGRNLRTREAFDIVSAQLRPARKLWHTTTPGGLFHWYYPLFFEGGLPDSKTVTVRTEENPHLPDEYSKRLRSQYTGAFAQQELDAEWVAFEGRVYDNFDLELNVSKSAEYNPDWAVEWGVDGGYAEGDGPGHANYHPRVILLGQITPEGGLNIFAEYVQTLEPDHLASIDEVLGWGYNKPELASVDSSEAVFRANLSRRGISNIGATHQVVEGIKNVRRLICDGNNKRLLMINPRCKHTIREMLSYRYDLKSSQAKGGEQKPLKIDDHTPDALRYLAWKLRY